MREEMLELKSCEFDDGNAEHVWALIDRTCGIICASARLRFALRGMAARKNYFLSFRPRMKGFLVYEPAG